MVPGVSYRMQEQRKISRPFTVPDMSLVSCPFDPSGRKPQRKESACDLVADLGLGLGARMFDTAHAMLEATYLLAPDDNIDGVVAKMMAMEPLQLAADCMYIYTIKFIIYYIYKSLCGRLSSNWSHPSPMIGWDNFPLFPHGTVSPPLSICQYSLPVTPV